METMRASDKYSDALDVTLAPSRFGATLCAAACTLTLALLAATPLPMPLACALAAYVAFLSLDAIRRLLVAHRLAIDPGVIMVDNVAGSLRAGSVVAPWLTIVRWRPSGSRRDRTLLVLPGRLPSAAFRHLRVILKHTPV